MKEDYINIGFSPYEETCVQVGAPNYREEALVECQRFIELLRKTFGPEPEGARLVTKWFQHDFGPYCEVICLYDHDIPASVEYALRCENETPATWNGEAHVSGEVWFG